MFGLSIKKYTYTNKLYKNYFCSRKDICCMYNMCMCLVFAYALARVCV